MSSQVLISQAKPAIWVEKTGALEKVEAFRVQSPSSVVISYTRQIVDRRINVRADGQTK